MRSKETRLYGLFERQEGKWIRLFDTLSFRKSVAVRLFQNHLLSGTMEGKEMALKPVKD